MSIPIRDEVSLVETDYGSVVLDESRGTYYQLNPTATVIAKGLLARARPEAIVASLIAEFDVERDTARTDVEQLAQRLREAGLLPVDGAA